MYAYALSKIKCVCQLINKNVGTTLKDIRQTCRISVSLRTALYKTHAPNIQIIQLLLIKFRGLQRIVHGTQLDTKEISQLMITLTIKNIYKI